MQGISIGMRFNRSFLEAQVDGQCDNCAVCFSDFFWEQSQLTLLKIVQV